MSDREMTMVERVARALCIDAGENPDTPTPYNPNADFLWQFYRKSARAAIEEMREPAKEMTSAEGVNWDYTCTFCGVVKEEYHLMIDAALKEPE